MTEIKDTLYNNPGNLNSIMMREAIANCYMLHSTLTRYSYLEDTDNEQEPSISLSVYHQKIVQLSAY